MSAVKRPASPRLDDEAVKKYRSAPPISAPSVHAWLHPESTPQIQCHSPPLHHSNSTFLSFSISLIPPTHITSEPSLAKECRRIVRELNVVGLVGQEVLEAGEGAFGDGEGRAKGSSKGKERAREPDHRMWAVRALCLKEGKDGTEGEGDYQLLESFNDDGENYGGERVLKILQEGRGVDVLTVCCRWFGGDMIGPVRFSHIGLTAQTSLTALLKLLSLKELRERLAILDKDIAGMRDTLNPPDSPLRGIGDDGDVQVVIDKGKYDDIDDIVKLERLVKARERTQSSLEDKVGWIGMEQSRAEETAVAAASHGPRG